MREVTRVSKNARQPTGERSWNDCGNDVLPFGACLATLRDRP